MLSLYGLTVASELDLPGLDTGHGEPELVIRCGAVPSQLESPPVRGICFQAAPGQFLLELDGVARYLVSEGREVIIERAPGAADEEIRTFLLGTVLGAVLYQRGLVPFHASAVLTPHGAVLFGGRSGAGKSTLAAALARRGLEVIADDVAAVTVTDVVPLLFGGPPHLWLWGDALKHLGIPAEPLGRVRPQLEKHIWQPGRDRTKGPFPVAAYYHLERHNQPTVVLTHLKGMERVRVLSNEIYRAPLSRALADPNTLFRITTAIGQHAHVVRVQRPNEPYLLDQLVDQVLADLESHAASAAPSRMSQIVWLASYPKSGNTWVRVFLTNYLRNGDTPADINALDGGPIASSREVFDELTGLEASELTPAEIGRLRPAVYRAMAANAPETIFMKVHDAWVRTPEGTPLVGEHEVTRAAIYLIRNPLDVAVSFAHHSGTSIDKAIDKMESERAHFAARPSHLSNQLAQPLLTWSGHVRSWVDDSGLPVCVVRYEDMRGQPLESFTRIVVAADLEVDSERVARAVDFSSFEVLRAQERAGSFKERSDRAESFFRKGVVGDWRRSLTDVQRDRILTSHGDTMRRFGYLEPAAPSAGTISGAEASRASATPGPCLTSPH